MLPEPSNSFSARAGLKPDDVVIQSIGTGAQSVIALERGLIDVGMVADLVVVEINRRHGPAVILADTRTSAGIHDALGVDNYPGSVLYAQPAWIAYAYSPSTRFPAVNKGGDRTAMAGPVYYYDEKNPNPHKLPKEFDHTLFIYEWSRNWIIAVHLDEKEQIAKDATGRLRMDPFCEKMTFKRPMDLELGPDGCLYLIEWGSAWYGNYDTQIERLEYRAEAK